MKVAASAAVATRKKARRAQRRASASRAACPARRRRATSDTAARQRRLGSGGPAAAAAAAAAEEHASEQRSNRQHAGLAAAPRDSDPCELASALKTQDASQDSADVSTCGQGSGPQGAVSAAVLTDRFVATWTRGRGLDQGLPRSHQCGGAGRGGSRRECGREGRRRRRALK